MTLEATLAIARAVFRWKVRVKIDVLQRDVGRQPLVLGHLLGLVVRGELIEDAVKRHLFTDRSSLTG